MFKLVKMSKMEFTPGPWKVQKSYSGKSNINIVGSVLGTKYKIARVPFMPMEDALTKSNYIKLKQEALADAQLISAAPDLLSALQEMLQFVDERFPAYKQAQAAINKATNI